MGRLDLEYPKESFSTVNRYGNRGRYNLKTIHEIVNTCPVLHVSFNTPDSPFPATLPMLGKMGSFSRPSADLGDVLDLYLHGYVSSRMINLARNSEDGKGIPMTIAATHVDGMILSLTPNTHSFNYRSAILFGRATVVTDLPEKLYAMEAVVNGAVPTRWQNSRNPPNNAEMQSTSVLRVRISHGSAKIRTGVPMDNREDMADLELQKRVWTGVIPMYQTFGTPIPGPYNQVEVPGYLAEYIKDTNEENVTNATTDALKEEVKPKKSDDADD
ncbi:hypothetical protein OQA88_10073 [Cercophora sp. LCS_1]